MKGKMQIYKNNRPLTVEQKKVLDLLYKQDDTEFARIYFRKCLKENYTNEWKQRLEKGEIEGVGLDLTEKILYIDMDNVLVDFQSALDIQPKEILEEYSGREDEIPNLFAQMQPMNDAIESFDKLSKIYDTYILSTAPWNNPSAWKDKLEWVKKHLGTSAYKRLIITHHKNLNKGDYLIDDRRKNGAGEFSGELIHFGSEKYPNWQAVRKYLM